MRSVLVFIFQIRLRARDYGIVRPSAAINAAVRSPHAAHSGAQACVAMARSRYSPLAALFGHRRQK
jgi:hypothetical protein